MAHPPRDAFQIGWICALPIEAAAATEMLDENFGILEEQDAADSNTYTLGRIKNHHVVIACLPGGQYGTTSATTVAINMLRTFSGSLRIGLLVGVGGGVPSASRDIRLGDIVISQPEGTCGGVVQYDMGKVTTGGGFERTGSLNSPPRAILTAVSKMRAAELTDDPRYLEYLQNAIGRTTRTRRNFAQPSTQSDRLFRTEHDHPSNASSCDGCAAEWEETRSEREEDGPQPHYGIIASGNKVIKDGRMREHLRSETGALCFEMEAAGLMLDFPCVVIRGVCDYADSHKNKSWQGYAALAAAAYTKELLGYVPVGQVSQETLVVDACRQISGKLDKVQKLTTNTLSGISDIRQTQMAEKYDDFLQWLATDELFFKQNDLVQRRTEGTGKWFLRSDELQRWLKDPHQNQTFLCTGIPGAGKTVLASIVISFLQQHFHLNSSVGTAYIFCDFNQEHIQKPWIFMESLLKQLARLHPNLPPVVELFENHYKPNIRPSLSELVKMFQAVVTSFSRVNIVIDALDECQAGDSLRGFLSIVFSLRAKSGSNISLLATSRHNGAIEALFGSSLRLEISAEEEDIRSYLDQRVTTFTYQTVKGNESLRADAIEKILEVAKGMFLLAELYANRMASLITISDAKRMLDELDSFLRDSNDVDGTRKSALDDAYREAMRRIKSQTGQQSGLALRILSWISCAKRPLRSWELQYAIAVEPGTSTLNKDKVAGIEALVSICAGLVIIDKKSRFVRLAHYTTQEYFDRTSTDWFPDAHIETTSVCVTYLSFDNFESHEDPDTKEYYHPAYSHPPFLEYAAQFWGHHARNTAIEEDQLILNFLHQIDADYVNSRRFLNLLSGKVSHYEARFKSLQLAAYFGLARTISELLSRSPQALSERNGHFSDMDWALFVAANQRWRNVSELLLDQGATITIDTMRVAAVNGTPEILKLFIERGPKSLMKTFGLASLEEAVRFGNQDTVKILLDEGIQSDTKGLTELMLSASRQGNAGITKMLLEAGGDPQPGVAFNFSSFSLATEVEYEAIRKSHEAIGKGHEAIVKLLLEKGTDPNPGAIYGIPPLQLAIRGGFEAIVKLLLKAGADPNPGAIWAISPLQLAIEKGLEAIVKLLLEAGANSEPIYLSIAIQGGHEGIARFLLDKGNSPDFEQLEPSHLIGASKNGWHTVVDIMLGHPHEIEARDPEGWTALMWAVREGHEKVARSLIQGGADVKSVYELALRCDNTFVLALVEESLSGLRDISSDTDMEPSDSELDLDEGDQEFDEED
ncbi:unnamed protein product [Penicillium salamii]|nr:unnamed protein product [Penicillium salamii]CAG8380024.1 unnamed protein product [Penicillium salamii]